MQRDCMRILGAGDPARDHEDARKAHFTTGVILPRAYAQSKSSRDIRVWGNPPNSKQVSPRVEHM